MPTLTPKQIYALTVNAGFKAPVETVTMTAIALSESGGNTDAHNTKGEDSRGLWQINVSESANPDLRGMDLFDPVQNAKAAKIVFDRQGYKAWSVFTTTDVTRSYQSNIAKAMDAAKIGTDAVTIGDIINALPVAGRTLAGVGKDVAGQVADNLNPLDSIGQVARALSQSVSLAAKGATWISNPRNLLRAGYVVIGAGLIVGALMIVAYPVAKPAVQGAAKVADIAL